MCLAGCTDQDRANADRANPDVEIDWDNVVLIIEQGGSVGTVTDAHGNTATVVCPPGTNATQSAGGGEGNIGGNVAGRGGVSAGGGGSGISSSCTD